MIFTLLRPNCVPHGTEGPDSQLSLSRCIKAVAFWLQNPTAVFPSTGCFLDFEGSFFCFLSGYVLLYSCLDFISVSKVKCMNEKYGFSNRDLGF